jgi:carboxymethylenebutenolidase
MGDMIEFASNGSKASGYLATPEGSGPGLVVIQEWWGLVPHIKDVCDRFATEGSVALAPDLFHGETTTEPDEANKKMMELDFPRAIKEITGAVEYLRAHDATNGKVGVLGFCMGGALTLATAANASIDAAVPFYGLPGDGLGQQNISCPVLGHWAEHDDLASVERGEALFAELRNAGVDATLHVYPGTEHAFFNDARPEVYKAEAADQAWRRTLVFLNQHLAD